jgi:hypothetical protein
MENNNQKCEKLIKSDIKISPIILKTNSSPSNNKLNNINNINIINYNKPYYHFKKKDFIISKNKIISNTNNINNINNINKNQIALSNDISKHNISSQYSYSPKLLKNEIIQIFTKTFYKNKNPRNFIKKIDVGIQSYKNEKIQMKSPKIKKFQLLKKLIDHSNNKNLEDIDYILESPYRGVEKIESPLSKTISSERNKNYNPIFINNKYKGYFCDKNYPISKSSLLVDNISNNRNIKKITNKYNEMKENKEINNPLKDLSKLSGVSCTKLRKVINYSLNHRINNLGNLIKKKINNNNSIIMKHFIIDSKTQNSERNKCVYSMITLKSRRRNNSEHIKQDTFNLDNESSFDNVIGNNIFQNKNKINYYIKNKYNYSPISFKSNTNLFKNVTIKNRIGSYYK